MQAHASQKSRRCRSPTYRFPLGVDYSLFAGVKDSSTARSRSSRKHANLSMRISPIVNVWLNNGASGQPSGEKPLQSGVAGLMGISFLVSVGLWQNVGFGRLLPNLVRPQSFLLRLVLTICAIRSRKHCLILLL